jgi:acyl-homoserine-lactone acylase
MRQFIFVFFLACISAASSAQIDLSRVTIMRDSFGVPHIHGGTDAEAEYGLAWAQCEDDFKDVQYQLLAGRGRLGEVLGKDGVLFDYGLKFLSIDTLVAARYDKDLTPSFRHIVDAYIQGVNDYARAHPEEVLVKNALPFQQQDVIKGYTLNLSLMAGMGMALKAIKEDRISEFMKPNEIGSNAMAIAPSRTEDNKAWLLVNSHQPLEGRFAWWEAHMMSDEGWNMTGGLFTGGMSVFVGCNPDLGWAHTTNYNTWGDIYQLHVKGSKYEYDGKWVKFTKRKIKLKLKLSGIMLAVTRPVLTSEYGPVFKTKKGYYALRFPAYNDIRAAEQWHRMNKAHSWNEFEAAIKMEAIPHFNIVYADKEGNIFYQSGGMYPKRNPSLNWHLPITANTSAYKWTELITYKDKPRVFDPACGFIYSANQTPLHVTGDDCNWHGNFPGLQLFEYNRGERFGEMMKDHSGKFTWDDFLRIKFDMSYSTKGTYINKLGTLYTLSEAKYPDIADAIAKLKHWNRQGGIDNKDATIAMLTHYKLSKLFKGPFAFLTIREKVLPEADAVTAVRWAKKFLINSHGTIDIPLGNVQRYIRGTVSIPAEGLYEVPRAADAKMYDEQKGIMRVESGDGYIQVVKFSKQNIDLQTISPYGSSAHSDSKHYTDQMQLFSDHKFRSMTFDLESIKRKAEFIYHPQQIDYNQQTRKK